MAESVATATKHHPYRRMLRYAAGQWRRLAWILGLTGVGAVLAAAQPLPLMLLADHACGAVPVPAWLGDGLRMVGLTDEPATLVWVAALLALVVYAVGSVLGALQSWLSTVAGQRIARQLAADLFHRLQRLSLTFHGRRPVGDSLSRLTGDAFAAQTVAETLLVAPFAHLLTIAVVAAAALQIDAPLALLALLMAPPLGASALFFGRRLKSRSRGQREAQSRLLSYVRQTLGVVPLVQASCTQGQHRSRYDQLAGEAVTAAQDAALTNRWFRALNGTVTGAGMAVLLWAGSGRVLDNQLTLGSLLVFLAYLRALQRQMQGLLGIWGRLRTIEASIDRVLEVLDTGEQVAEPTHPRPLPDGPQRRRGHVRLEGVSFGYQPDRPVLHEVDLEALPGRRIALVGPTGGGKTTLVSLIPRFFDPWQGRVTFDGIDVRELRLRDLRSRIALLRQDPLLLPMTVAENIAYGRPDASRADIVAAARAADAHDFIVELADGYDTVVAERGATLSGGQRQRIALARVLLKQASVVLLDEPSASLDVITEAHIVEALMRRECTLFVIAHRLSTVRTADRILVLDEGRIREAGSHAELLAAGGLYRRFCDLQFGAVAITGGAR